MRIRFLVMAKSLDKRPRKTHHLFVEKKNQSEGNKIELFDLSIADSAFMRRKNIFFSTIFLRNGTDTKAKQDLQISEHRIREKTAHLELMLRAVIRRELREEKNIVP